MCSCILGTILGGDLCKASGSDFSDFEILCEVPACDAIVNWSLSSQCSKMNSVSVPSCVQLTAILAAGRQLPFEIGSRSLDLPELQVMLDLFKFFKRLASPSLLGSLRS